MSPFQWHTPIWSPEWFQFCFSFKASFKCDYQIHGSGADWEVTCPLHPVKSRLNNHSWFVQLLFKFVLRMAFQVAFTGVVNSWCKSSLGMAKSQPTGSLLSERDEQRGCCHSIAFLFSSRPARTETELDRGHAPTNEPAYKCALFNIAQ